MRESKRRQRHEQMFAPVVKALMAERQNPPKPPARISKKQIRALIDRIEDHAAKCGSSASQPLGVLMGPPGEETPHTRRNRHVLWGVSGGLNKAASALRDLLDGKEPAL